MSAQQLTPEEVELVKNLGIWDQTIGCDFCGHAWWGEDATPKVEDFHAAGCPLKGRRDLHEAAKLIDYGYLDSECPDDHRVPGPSCSSPQQAKESP